MAEQEAAKNTADATTPSADISPKGAHVGVVGHVKNWIAEDGPWWLCSFIFHVVLVCSLALAGGKVVEKVVDEAPSFEEATVAKPVDAPQEIERFEVGRAPEEPTELNPDSLAKPVEIAQDAKVYDESATFREAGGGVASNNTPASNLSGLGGFDVKGFGPGPAAKGRGGVGLSVGAGVHLGSGGAGWGFGGRGAGQRKALLGSGGGTRDSERAVVAALNWLARHQSNDGSWSLTAYKARCKDGTCTGDAKVGSYESAATALALLPFLASGQTHKSAEGHYKKTIAAGISFLIRNQKPDGDLRMGATMYAHGLASIVLCECYGMSNDKMVGRAAQKALNFIMDAQDPVTGGWRYVPRMPGDTSVTGWQVMSLKSGRMAFLNVNEAAFDKAKAFLKTVTSDHYGPGRFTYMPGKGLLREDGRVIDDGRATTAVGLLCLQYMGMPRSDAAMAAGTAFLVQNPPDAGERDMYYWYYATQVMHNQPGPDWDAWNRKMRHVLIDTQCKAEKSCAAGSWDPMRPTADLWGAFGGRLCMTSLAALTLEVYYRYLPLYQLDQPGGRVPANAAKKAATEKPRDRSAGK